MNILIVGNILKDVYLNLDSRNENFETDQHGIKWLDLSFDASMHHFFSQNISLGGSAVTLEVLTNLGIPATINHSDLHFTPDGPAVTTPITSSRYILISDGGISYLAPSKFQISTFDPPAEPYDYLYIDRSASLDQSAASKIQAYLDISLNTKLILYLHNLNNPHLNSLIPRSALVFVENFSELSSAPSFKSTPVSNLDPNKIIDISETHLASQNITEPISIGRIDMLTHLSAYSIASATILGAFALGLSVEESLKLACLNVEHSRLDSTLTLEKLQSLKSTTKDNLELIAQSLVLRPKGILAADESGGSIHKKFDQLHIPDTYDNRRDYRNIFFTTPNLEQHVNGIILFDETARQLADNGQNFVEFLTAKRIIPGIKVDQGLEKYSDSTPPHYNPASPARPDETWTKGLSGLADRLQEYYQMGLRFAKWRAAFEIRLDDQDNIITPTNTAIDINCQILADYALQCQKAGLVPIVEPEVVYDGYYTIDQSAEITGKILDCLFKKLVDTGVNLRACLLKVNMVLAGKKYETQSTPAEVGTKTAETLKNHVPSELAGIVFLSGGQTPEQATDNLAEIIKNGPFPWPVTFSFARALQDPALFAWQGDNQNTETARQAFLERLIANTSALQP
ncbi:MAG: fructose-bisphosphate aldolase class I [Candidatus Saccharibacteria bacterium]|nr:fructose-bisphosphate aldolase class I [Candidatus Saccharibacteria bacterium]